MIFNIQTKDFQTRSDKPNENWTDDDTWIVIEDGSELMESIIALYPYFDLVLNDMGGLVGITPTEPPLLESEPELEPSPDLAELQEAIRILTGGADDELDW